MNKDSKRRQKKKKKRSQLITSEKKDKQTNKIISKLQVKNVDSRPETKEKKNVNF